MRTSGRNLGGRLGLALVFVAALAGVAAAASGVAGVPEGDAYTVEAALVPGSTGADLLGDERGQGHVVFRVRFGADMRLTVNGADAGPFEPSATYRVSVVCAKVDGLWLATTHVLNQSTGAVVFHQCNYAMAGAAEDFHATAEDVIELNVQ